VPDDPVPDSGDISVEREGRETVVVRLRGDWLLESGLPALAPVEQALSETHAKKVTFDARELRDWDSALVAFLEKLREISRQAGATVDASGLPPGAQRLLRLAEAVPEKPGVRR